MVAVRLGRLGRGALKAFNAKRKDAAIKLGDEGINTLSEAQVAEITEEDFNTFSKDIKGNCSENVDLRCSSFTSSIQKV